jgi:riboflavin synthase
MFTGIVQGTGLVRGVSSLPGAQRLEIDLPSGSEKDLTIGASISVDGVCLTVTQISDRRVFFDVMQETLSRSSLGGLRAGSKVNIERAAKDGAEIGGHAISGHVDCTATLIEVLQPENNHVLTLQAPHEWMKYIFSKGYIALNGASLTVTNVNKKEATFQVWLIPETLRMTTFGEKGVGELVNVEIERGTQVTVDAIREYLDERLKQILPAVEKIIGLNEGIAVVPSEIKKIGDKK